MGWVFTDDVGEYDAAVGSFLRADPVLHTVALTVLEQLRGGSRWSDDPVVLAWRTDASAVVAAALMTPPFPLMLVDIEPADVDDLVAALRAHNVAVPAVNGEQVAAEAFATAWTDTTGTTYAVERRERLYRLGELSAPPHPASGGARAATSDDLDLVVEWVAAFQLEALHAPMPADHQRQRTAEMVGAGRCWLWEDAEPVAMSGRNPTVSGVARVGPVYTPPMHRGRGYGTDVTAACTRDALDRGAEGVVLFTDLANPTSNAIYQTIGYRAVMDRVVLRFVGRSDA